MPKLTAEDRARTAAELDRLRDRFVETNKAHFASLAVLTCHQELVPYPYWLIDFLILRAGNEVLMEGRTKAPSAHEKARALGVGPGGVRAAQEFRWDEYRTQPVRRGASRGSRELAAAVWGKLATGDYGKRKAWRTVSTELNSSYSVVKRAWKQHEAFRPF